MTNVRIWKEEIVTNFKTQSQQQAGKGKAVPVQAVTAYGGGEWSASRLGRVTPHFTEPQGSLPHSQASATCLYPGPAQSSPYTHIPPPGDPY